MTWPGRRAPALETGGGRGLGQASPSPAPTVVLTLHPRPRQAYRPCAQRASVLFFVLNDMGRIDPMYQFSLDAYIGLFILSIDKSHRSNKLEDRIDYLNEYHTYAVYRSAPRTVRAQPSVHRDADLLASLGRSSWCPAPLSLQLPWAACPLRV